MYEKSRSKQIAVLVTLMLAMALSGCSNPQVVETGTGYEAKRLDAKAWATTDSSQPKNLLLLNDSLWHDLYGESMVTTDGNGQAQLRKEPSCMEVYVYQDSGLKISPCSQGGGAGNCAVGAIISKDCDVSIRTMPADVQTIGTWFGLTYLEESQVTLVIVGEGSVVVTPTTQLEFEVVDREQLVFEVITRELGEEVAVENVNREEPRLLYTAPDERLEELQALGDLPPARAWLGMQELPAVREALSQLDPMLNVWLEQFQEQAAQDDIRLVVTLIYVVDGEPRPNLAQEWVVSDDGLEWTFFLAQDREMADGTPYTAEIILPVLEEEAPRQIQEYAGAEAPDDYTIMVFLESPNPDFLREIAQIELPR